METKREPVGSGDLVERLCQGDTAWSEREMRGTLGDGSRHLMRGIDEGTWQPVQVGAVPIASRPTATPPGAGSKWTER